MQLLKQFGKQLGFVVLIGSAIFPVSSAITQAAPRPAPVKSEILVNTDVIYGVNRLKCLFDCNTTTKLDVVRLGGVMKFDTNSSITGGVKVNAFKFDPFGTDYLNNKPVGGSKFKANFSTSRPKEVEGIFEEKDNNILRLDIDYIDSQEPNRKYNPPGRAYNGTTCKDSDGCVILHYGYTEEVTSNGALDPAFFQTLIELRDLDGNTNLEKPSMASPILGNSLGGGVTQYLVVYHEQTDPVQPDVVIGNWTEFPVGAVAPEQIQSQKTIQKIVQTQPQSETLSFTNSDPSAGSITISNTRFLRSATQIPLEQLNAIDLPPTDPRFIPLPTVNGTIAPGETTTPVPVLPPNPPLKQAMTWIINTVVYTNRKTYVQARSDGQTNPYSGDTSVDQALPLLCINKPPKLANNPIPNFTQSVPTPGGAEKNSWSNGEVFAIPNVVGSSLLSSADADRKCETAGQNRYGLTGSRMAEFHDGGAPNAGWGFWAQSDDPTLSIPGIRYWVKINDQNANPW